MGAYCLEYLMMWPHHWKDRRTSKPYHLIGWSMGKLQAYLTIPIKLSENGAYYTYRLKLSSLQARIIIELSRRPCYLRMLEKKLNRPSNVVLDSLRSLEGKNVIKSIIYVSPRIMDKAGVRRYYILRRIHKGCGEHHKSDYIQKMMKIFTQDDKYILRMREYAKAMNMLQSPNPAKQSIGRQLLRKLATNPQ
jgi:DNA-binding MarR family transcriptional regulator